MRYYSDILKEFYDHEDDLISAENKYKEEQEQILKDKEQYQILVDKLNDTEETYRNKKSKMAKDYDEQCKKYTDAYEELMSQEYKLYTAGITALNEEFEKDTEELKKKIDEFEKTHSEVNKTESSNNSMRNLLEMLFSTL